MHVRYYQLILIKIELFSLYLGLFLTFSMPILFIVYQVFMAVSIWRSSSNYQGKKIWGILAKSFSVLYPVALVSVFVVLIFSFSKADTNDPGKNSSNIAKFLKRDPQYPLVGFWENHCSDNFGLSIAEAGNGFYSVSFYGRGCFKPGTYRPNTKIVGDSEYKIIDNNTIQVRGVDGLSTYKRCD